MKSLASNLLIVVTPTLALLGLQAGDISWVRDHHWVVVVPGMVLLASSFLYGIVSSHVRHILTTGTFLALGAGLLSLSRNATAVDWEGAATYLQQYAGKDEPVLVFPSPGQAPFGFLFGDRSRVIGLPIQELLIDPLPLHSATHALQRIELFAPSGTPYWFIRENVGDILGIQYIGDALRQHQQLDHRYFRGLDVFHMRTR